MFDKYALGKIQTMNNNVSALNTTVSNINKIISVSAVSNIYTLNLSTATNFLIETTDTTAKTITLTNIPQTDNNLISVVIRLKYTSAAAITHPSGVTWQNATTPTFTAGKKYWLLYQSADKGATWLGSCVGAW